MCYVRHVYYLKTVIFYVKIDKSHKYHANVIKVTLWTLLSIFTKSQLFLCPRIEWLGVYCFCPVCLFVFLFVCLSVCCQL